MKFNKYGDALRHIRVKTQKSHRDIARFVIGATEDGVRAWENGTAYPNGYQLKGLGIMMPQLRHFVSLIPHQQKNLQADMDLATSQATGLTFSLREAMTAPGPLRELTRSNWNGAVPPPGEPPPTEADLKIKEPTTFGESLKLARLREGLSQEELAELVGVSATAVAGWEAEAFKPVDVSWESIRSVLPDVVEPQDRKSWPKPQGRSPGGGATPDAPAAAAPPAGEKWRQGVAQIVGAASQRGLLAESLAQAVQDAIELTGITARQLLAALNEAMGLAKEVRGALPVHVVAHERSAPGTREDAAAPVEAPPPPAPAWPPPAPEYDVPQLPGLAGAGVRYAVAMAKLQHEESVKREVERRLEEAQLAVDIAKEELQAANEALVKQTQAGGPS